MTAKEQAEAHWSYVEGLLKAFNPEADLVFAKYLYVTSFVHGFKHSEEEGA